MDFEKIKFSIYQWFDSGSKDNLDQEDLLIVNWIRVIPFLLIHVGCLAVFFVGISKTSIIVAVSLYFVRMLGITAFYHRYFSHRAFKTTRVWQFIFALIGASAAQRGPLWWASHHRHHHLYSDKKEDKHSPHHQGFWWSHMLRFMSSSNFKADYNKVHDLRQYQELVYLDRFDMLIPVLLIISLYFLGGIELVVWGFFISTVCVFHSTFSINSLAHKFGTKRYNNADESRNNFWLAIITLGEGWHNNHHHFPGSCKQGFYWWEVDITYYFLKLLAILGIISNLKYIPEELLNNNMNNISWTS